MVYHFCADRHWDKLKEISASPGQHSLRTDNQLIYSELRYLNLFQEFSVQSVSCGLRRSKSTCSWHGQWRLCTIWIEGRSSGVAAVAYGRAGV